MLHLLLTITDEGTTEFNERRISRESGVPYQQVRTIHKNFLKRGIVNAIDNAKPTHLCICKIVGYETFRRTTNAESNAEIETLKKENLALKSRIDELNKKLREDNIINNNISLADFEVCWKAYNRKGSKKKSLEQWQKLTDEERLKVLPHVKAYVGSRDLQFQKDFERYLRDKTFEEVIIKGNDTIYDPDKFDKTNEYHPTTDGIFQYWNDERQCLMFNGYIDQLNDGYTDDTRPDGAKVAWSMYEWIWSSRTKQWIKQND